MLNNLTNFRLPVEKVFKSHTQHNNMSKKQSSKTLGIVSIVLGAISFIPLIGFFIGIFAIIVGIVDIKKNKSKLGLLGLILGILGIFITIGLYGSLFYFGFVQRGGVYDDLRSQMESDNNLPNAVNAIEAYKARFGKYPNTIEDLKQISNDPLIFIDQMQLVKKVSNPNETNNEGLYFYYQNNGETYVVFSKGIDGQPFTEDDIYPKLTGDLGDIGYRKPK